MAWQDSYREASFRGVPFFVESHGGQTGRRGETHEYPERDEPYAEDRGRRARGYSVQAYVLGPDYMAARDALIAAMETEGPGTLVHPYLGTLQVQPRDCSWSESTKRGGIATLSLRFDEAGENQFPSSAADSGSAVRDNADFAWVPVLGEFDANFNVSKVDWLRVSAEELVIDGVDAMEDQLSTITSLSGDLGEFTSYLESMRTNVGDLVVVPTQLATEISSGLVSLARLPTETSEGFQALVGLGAFAPLLVEFGQSTPARVQQSQNEEQFLSLMREGATIEAARLVPDMEFASRADAQAVRDTITGLLDAEMISTSDDDVYRTLSALYASVVADLQGRGATLALVRRITLAATEPALTLAHRLYQDPTRDQEIVDRNRIQHPGFIPGGTAIEVLTDAP